MNIIILYKTYIFTLTLSAFTQIKYSPIRLSFLLLKLLYIFLHTQKKDVVDVGVFYIKRIKLFSIFIYIQNMFFSSTSTTEKKKKKQEQAPMLLIPVNLHHISYFQEYLWM